MHQSLKTRNHTNPQSLEYAALLSGLSMAGTDIADDHIQSVRHLHENNMSAPAQIIRSFYSRPAKH